MRATEYGRAISNLRAFLGLFGDLIAMCQPVDTFGLYPSWQPKAGMTHEAGEVFMTTSRLAGRAADAFHVAGISVNLGNGGLSNQAVLWATMFERAALLDPRRLLALTNEALGVLEERQRRQANAERGLVGLLAWFFTIPMRVREAAGMARHSRPGRVVTWLTAALQGLVVSKVGGVLVYPVTRLFGVV